MGSSPRIVVITEGTAEAPFLDPLCSADGPREITILACESPAPGGAPRSSRGAVRVFHPAPAGSGKPDVAAFLLDPERRLNESDIVVLVGDAPQAALVAVASKEKFGKKLVVLAHEERHFPRVYPPDVRTRLLRAVLHRSADAFVAVTERARDVLVVEGVPAGKIAVLPPGVDTERFAPDPELRARARARRGIGPTDREVLFVGRLEWDDGVFDLLHAAKLLAFEGGAERIPVSYTLAGRGPEAARVREVVDELGLTPRVRFVEEPPGFGTPEGYNGADVLVVSAMVPRSWADGLGVSLLEAMACGVAVVAAHSGSVPEIVGDAGILVPPADPGELARGIGRVLRDDALRADLGERGRKRVLAMHDTRRAAGRWGDFLGRLARG